MDPQVSLAHLPLAACPRCETSLEPEDLRCPLCGLTAPAVAPAAESAASASDQPPAAAVIRCTKCRACVAYSAEDRAPRCAYCGAEASVDVPEDPPEQPGAFLPFRVQPEQAREALRRYWLGLGFFRPKDLASASRLESLQPIWWPAWVVDATAEIHWTADSDSGAGRAEWAPHAGHSRLVLRDCAVPASRGLSERECAALIPGFDLGQALGRVPQEPTGALVEQFELRRSGARARILAAVQARAERAVAETQIPGARHRHVHVAAMLTGLKTARYALPTYVLAYRYRDQLHRALVHGQDVSQVMATAPYSWSRIALVALAGIGAVALATLLIHFAAGR